MSRKTFIDKNLDTLVCLDSLFISPNTIIEVKNNKMRLKNNKAPGLDRVKSEDFKTMSDLNLCLKLNAKSNFLRTGYIVPSLKSGKIAPEATSYRPIILMSAWRKLGSIIAFQRTVKKTWRRYRTKPACIHEKRERGWCHTIS